MKELQDKEYDKAVDFILKYTASKDWKDIKKLKWTTSEVAGLLKDYVSERQTNTEVSEQHDSKALHIADVSHSYNFSTNYDELYDLVVNKNEIIFCKLLYKMDEISSFDYTVIRKRRDNSIMCGVRGLTYFDVYDWSIEHNSDCKTMKDVFVKYCKMLKLEFVSPNCG